MKAKTLKKLNDKIPDFIKIIISKPIRYMLINNNVFKNEYRRIIEFKSLNNQEREKIQFDNLKKILCYAFENTIYYKKIFSSIGFNPYNMKSLSDIKKIPLIAKEDIIQNENSIISKEKLDYYIATTGGSTGKPLKILLEKESIYKEKAFIYSYWSNLGYDYKKSKLVTFRGVNFYNKIKKINPIYNEILLNPFILNEKNISDYIKIINKFKADYIHGYPSAIYNFCKLIYMNNLKLDVKIKGVFFISENVYKNQREFIEEVLNCKTLSFYGHSERAVFAEEYNEKYTFNDLYGYSEVVNINGEKRIVCTGFLNKKMPLIRYLTDDYVEGEEGKYAIVGHRSQNYLIGKNNEVISMAAMEFHSNVFSKIRFYQFEQNEKGKVVFNIVEENKLISEDIEKINYELKKKFDDIIEYEIRFVNKPKLTSRGKFNLLIQNIK